MSKLKRAQMAFSQGTRTDWEALWDTCYRYIAPERETFFREHRTASEIGSEVFDATAIDSAERLVNLIISGLTPPWMKWFRLEPGTLIQGEAREELRPQYKEGEELLFARFAASGFYGELQPMLLDRVVGGTGGLTWAKINGVTRFKCAALADLAIDEDASGRVSCAVYRQEWSVADLKRRFKGKLPQAITQFGSEKDQETKRKVFLISERQADGQWENTLVLEHDNGVDLEKSTTRVPRVISTRWAKVPGTPYGRGPGLRALSDVRAMNKLKELTLKNAAKAVAGVYTAVSDGVLNPYTMVFEPGAVIPVATNDINNPSLRELPNTARFDVSSFSMDALETSIKRTFMLDQFGDLDRTPRSATEVAERSRILAHDLGATISRLQEEVILPVLQLLLGDIGTDIQIDGVGTDVVFISRLAQAQLFEEEQSYLDYVTITTQFGQIDPKAGLVLDVHKALRRIGEMKAIHPEDMRTSAQIQEIIDEATAVVSEAGLEAPDGGVG